MHACLLFSFTSLNLVFFGVFLAFIFLGVRGIAVKISTLKSHLNREQTLMTIMLPRGLAAAVLASLPLTVGVPGSQAFPEIVFLVILTTIIICTVGIAILKRKRREEHPS